MRLKNVPGAQDVINSSGFVQHDPESFRGKWKDVFGNGNPIELEIGIGKGRFLLDMAEAFPHRNFLGIEMYSSVLCRAIQNAEQRVTGSELHLSVSEKERPKRPDGCNFRMLRFDATYITQLFEPGEIRRIYLNFSDPWPKERHADRRLTSVRFLGRYEKILPAGGEVIFKTDNRALFDFSIEQLNEHGWDIMRSTYDLHGERASGQANGLNGETSILTEYEEKFVSSGKPICMLTAACPARGGAAV